VLHTPCCNRSIEVRDPANNRSANPVQNETSSIWDVLPCVYLLRVQLLTFLTLISFPFIALWLAPNLLRGVFDVTAPGMIFVTLGAALASWTVMVTAWQVLLYGPERFRIRSFPVCSARIMQVPTRKGHSPVFALFALPVVLVAMYVSRVGGSSTYPRLALGFLGGAALATGILVGGGQFQRRGWSEAKAVTKFLSSFGPGFKKDDRTAREGHYLALWSFLLCFLVYVAIGIGKFFRIGGQPTVPTLADFLVFLMILCWGLSAVTFILDRFRIPVLLPFLIVAIATSSFGRTDHYFYMFPAQSSADLSPAEVIRAGKPGTTVIVVAASGGGIKAAAWTARVLTGLEKDSRAAFSVNPRIFGDSVRLISAVSGGSVGAMYFVNEYDSNGGGLPQNAASLEEAVKHAEASSLDDIAWGVVYPDFLRIFLPVFKHLDRGLALEAALTRELQNGGGHLSSPLGEWRGGVLKGWRPAVIFNATIVESGQRFLLGTADLKPASGRTSLRDAEFPQFAGRDITLVTAARLSATFPYVSPAARPDIPAPQIHVVDGGYTDNYGMATLLAWLDEALSGPGNTIRRVLIIEIRASPPAVEPPALHWRGWPFQWYAPISAMLNVRDTGQLPRNEEEREILRRLGAACNIEIKNAVFEYPPEDAPLSWHFSPNDGKQIETIWASAATASSREDVRNFLAAPPPATVSSAACQ
jgi:hypothetical protein